MKKILYLGMALALLCGCDNGSTTKPSTVQTSTADTVVTPETEVPSEGEAPEVAEIAELSTARYLDALPADYQEGDGFGLILSYGGYAMDVSAWPMADGDWLITSHWCMEEDEGMVWVEDEEGNEGPFIYEDPFEGHPYPVIHKADLSFGTRNYGGETINFYAAPDSDEILCSTDFKEISLDVVAADLKTRRLLVRSNPNDWCWGEPENEYEAEYRHPFVDLQGWVDEEWVCGNTVSTCP